MHAAFLDFATLGDGIDDASLRNATSAYQRFETTSAAELVARCQGLDAVFTNKCRFDAATFQALPDLKYIGLTATGSDGVDLAAAAEAGVAVCNITAYCTQSVVQHVFAVLLSLTHQLPQFSQAIADGQWQKHDAFCLLDFPIRELAGLKFGIVGYGELGQAVGRVAEALGMQLLIAARQGTEPAAGRVSLDALWRDADVISLHCPLNPATTNLVNAATLAHMKPTAILINTARGGLVDANALAAALRTGQIAGAAIDVLDKEPPDADHPLLDSSIPHLLVTPHIAWAAREARQRALDQTAEHFTAFLAGNRSNRLDP
ncbi:MAG: D-2-hydroxyacid dehydrogenase [Woeseiaceae bacterium]